MNPSHDGPAPLPSYRSPPLGEVIFGCHFPQLPNGHIPHVGAFWVGLRDRFPKLQHKEPLARPDGEVSVDSGTGLPLPRVWMTSRDETRLIQLQTDRLLYNWRKRPGAEYPRFKVLYPEFKGVLADYRRCMAELDAGEVLPQVGEVAYVNHLLEGDTEATPDQIQGVLDYIGWPAFLKSFELGAPRGMQWQAVFPLPSKLGRLTVKVTQGTRAYDGRKVLLFELVALGDLKDAALNGIDSWYASAHEAIVKSFTEMTSDQAHQQWGRE